MKKHFFLWISIILLMIPLEVKSQEMAEYEISVAGFKIGEMVTKKTIDGNNTDYELNTKVSFWFLGNVLVDFKSFTQYSNNKLISSKSTTTSNKGNFRSNINWMDGKQHYRISTSSYKYELDTIISKPFDYSTSKLYFEEPIKISEFMAENFGLPSPIQKIKDYYEVDVNGNKNRFYYINGVLDKAVMQSPIKNYVVKRKNL